MTEIRPDYYKSGGLEAFEVIDAFDLGFNLGNAFKYIARAGKKWDKAEDLRKAVTYLNREIEKEDKKRIDEDFRKKIDEDFRKKIEEDFRKKIDTAPLMIKNKESDYEAGRQENL